MTAQPYVSQLSGEAAGEALSALCVLGKTKAGREEINALLGDRLSLWAAARSEKPKIRKNAYRLMGALEDERDLPVLRASLQKEETLFAIPSLLLALGKLGDEGTLRAYGPPASLSPETDGLVAQIVLARDKALQGFETYGAETITRLPAPRKVLCYAPEGFLDMLMEELQALGFDPAAENGAAAVVTDRIDLVYQADCMAEALLPIARDVPLDAEGIAQRVGMLPGDRYRIELRGYTRDRRKLIAALAKALPGQNNPSAYDTELRVDCHMDRADLYLKLWNVADSRYPWRQRTVSASIHPATAACLVRYAKKFETRERPRVLDPFCGCGSLLFAREKLGPCRVLMGVDKSGTAVESARVNARAGKSKAAFVTKDILRFEGREGFDLILSNLPFGNRVGSHEDNTRLYDRFVRRLPDLLSPGGVAVLYTMEYKLLKACLDRARGLTLRAQKRTEAGGLLPWIFVVDRDDARC
ncbi:MAG: methyltransferase domain-containing protein [Clostridia bacterium]|nr:methyltransferase domain-containing protein [Clostridia bacterium]